MTRGRSDDTGSPGALGSRAVGRLLVPLLAAALVTTAAVGSGQQDVEDLFRQARETMNSGEPYGAVQIFSRVIAILEQEAAAGGLDEERGEMLGDAYEGRALTRFYFAEQAEAEEDLRALLRLRPHHTIDRSVTPSFVELFDRLKDEMVGIIELSTSPPEVDVSIDGRAVDPLQRRHPVLEGAHRVRASRPGYAPETRTVAVEAGEIVPVQFELDRVSAVLELISRPVGVTIHLDDREIGTTSGSAPADFIPTGEAARYPVREFSDEMAIDGIMPGEHRLRAEKDGYRSRVFNFTVETIGDMSIPPILLEETEGVIELRGLPDGARVTVGGSTVVPERSAAGQRLTLPPGEHRVVVDHGTAGTFEEEVSLADRETVTVDVDLRPGVALLAILGEDTLGTENLLETLRSGFDSRDQWSLLDRRQEAAPELADHQMTTETLRELAASAQGSSATIDWDAVQSAFDERISGSIYIVAVLDDDLLATHADLWVWPASPGPANPDRIRVELEDPDSTARVLDSFSVSLLNSRPWVGALLIDGVDPGAMVAHVTAGGPAEAAGIQVGDRIVALAGDPIAGAAAAMERILEREPDTNLAVRIHRQGAEQDLQLKLGRSPMVLSLSSPDRVYSALWAAAAAELGRADSQIPDWVLQLNMAASQIHADAWADAVNTLRRIQGAPTGGGVGQAAIDYWLGIALTGAGPTYVQAARDAFERAAAVAEARLYHHDGPWVAPRARARLAVLGSS